MALLSGLLRESGISHYLNDKKYTEVAINRPGELWTESSEGWQRHSMPHLDYKELYSIAHNFSLFNKTEISPKNPICSGIMPNGQRGQVVVPTACEMDTVSITVRRPSDVRFNLDAYAASGRLNRWNDVSSFQTKLFIANSYEADKLEAERQEITRLERLLDIPEDVHLRLYELQMLEAKAERNIVKFLNLAVIHKQNIVLVGATGSGKTTFTKAVCDIVPLDTRIVTIEDTAELDLPYHPNKVHMFYKDVNAKELLKSCMRMKPDRIFLTELRGDEAYDYLNALNTGHAGSITTVHANDCESAYYRVATLVEQSEVGKNMKHENILNSVFTTLDVIMYLDRTYVTEVAYDPVRKYRLLKNKVMKG